MHERVVACKNMLSFLVLVVCVMCEWYERGKST